MTEKTTATLAETVDYLKAVETEKLTDDVKAKVEAIDNKPIVVSPRIIHPQFCDAGFFLC